VRRHLLGQGFALQHQLHGTNSLAFMLKTKSSSWISPDKYPGSLAMAAMGSSVLKQTQIQTDSSSFHAFEICDFIVLKTISRGCEDWEGRSAVVSDS
jgi:hypothetical protein